MNDLAAVGHARRHEVVEVECRRVRSRLVEALLIGGRERVHLAQSLDLLEGVEMSCDVLDFLLRANEVNERHGGSSVAGRRCPARRVARRQGGRPGPRIGQAAGQAAEGPAERDR
ncbi:MAG: hypothetical protein JRG92_21730 [Deltaproteobacteria bacterium]|nr:hypothetical protein [Deltaproteobacteria bacterium]